MKNTPSKYWYAEQGADAYSRTITVDVYTTQDDEHLATIELMYHYNPMNDNESWTIESAYWSKELLISEADNVMSELTYGASDHFHEFAHECYHFNPFDESSWCV